MFGHYLQDWLLKDSDYSWRLEPDKGGASSALGDIGSHWCDLAQHVTGLRITHVLGEITTVVPRRKRPKGIARRLRRPPTDCDLVDIKVEDLASVMVRFDNGARGTFTVGQVCAGHKNDCFVEVCGLTASMRWVQEEQNRLWIGHRDKANETLAEGPVAPRPAVQPTRTCPAGTRKGRGRVQQHHARRLRIIAAGKADAPAAGLRIVRGWISGERHRGGHPRQRPAGGVWTKVKQSTDSNLTRRQS